MGLFDFLKGKKQTAELRLEDVDSYTDSLWKELHMDERAREYIEHLTRQKSLLELALNRLESAWLQNDNITPREKTIMQGNKTAYVQRARRFITELTPPKEERDLERFIIHACDAMETLAEDTRKNVFILKEFLANNINDVLRVLREIDTSTIRMREALQGTNAQQIQKIRDAMQAYREAEAERTRLEQERIAIADSVFEARKTLHTIQQEHEAHQQSPAIQEKNRHEVRLEELKQEEQAIMTDFNELLSLLGRAMHKHAHGAQEKRVNTYTSDPVNALLEDEGLQIRKILNEIDLDQHEPKYTKRARARVMIERFSTEELTNIRNKLKKTQQERETIDNSLKKISKSLKPELATKYELAKNALTRAEMTLQQHDVKMERLSMQAATEKISEALNAVNARLI